MPWIAAGAALVGGYLSNRSSAKQAAIARDEAGRYSGTAHQREAQDLSAAGLNRILSGTGGAGASTPSGMVASQQADYSAVGSRFIEARRAKQELKTMHAQAEAYHASSAQSWEQQNVLSYQAETAESLRNVQRLDEKIAERRQKGDIDAATFWSSKPYHLKRRLDAAAESARILIPLTTPGHSAYGSRKRR